MDLIERYVRLGLALGRHIEGLVDAYYGPPAWSEEEQRGAPAAPAALAERAQRLLGDLDGTGELDPARRAWVRAQTEGLHTTARRLAGQPVAFLDEIERCYGVRPAWVDEEAFAQAHRRLDGVLPRSAGATLAERYANWTEAQAVPPDRLPAAVGSLAEDFRARTAAAFGLPDGERVDFVLETGRPWSGFNYYLGGLRSRVAINTDLPVLSTHLGHLVAHEAYPGHHTEHVNKEVGLFRRRQQTEESIFLVGTPQCLLAEGLADLGLEMVAGERPETVVEAHLAPLRIPYEAGTAGEVARASETLGAVRGNAAIGLHDRSWTSEQAVAYIERWRLLPSARAEKQVEFLTDRTWRAYTFCYIEGLARCRRFVGGDPARFRRLLTEQLLPSQLEAAAAAP
jgi:hypothetical protein